MAGRFSIEGTFRMVDRISRPLRGITTRIERMIRNTRNGFGALREIGRRFAGVFATAGAAVAGAGYLMVQAMRDVIETGRDFDQTMTSAAAKFPGGIRRGSEEFARLEEAAQRTGRETEFSASQAAGAIDFLAMAGFNAEQSVAALPGVVNLATAAQMDLAEATDVASDTLGAFGLMTEDATQLGTNLARVNDVLARTSTSANTTVAQMFEAIRTGGPVATAAGASIETFSSLLGTLAGSGVKGSIAGTALRTVFQRLQAPTGAAARRLRQLHVSTQDADHNFRDINEILGELGRSLDGMGSAERANALNDIFGAEGLTSATLLLEAGEDRLNSYRTSLEGATGAASEMATMMRDTAGGDLASMNSAIEGLKLQIWALVRGPVRDIVQGITEWVRANQDVIASGIEDTIAWLTDNMEDIVFWGTRIGIVFGIIAGAVLLFSAVVLAAMALIPAMIIGVIVLLGALNEWLMGFAEPIMEAFGRMWETARGVFTAIAEFAVGLFVLIGRAVMQHLAPVFAILRAAAGFFMSAWSAVAPFFSSLWGAVSAAFTGAFGGVLESTGGVIDALMTAFEPVGEFFASLWNGIADGFSSSVGWVMDQIGSFVGDVRVVGRGAMEDGGGEAAGRAAPQMVTPQERAAREVSEHTSTERSEVTIRDETNRAEVTRRPRSTGRARVRLQPSGAM